MFKSTRRRALVLLSVVATLVVAGAAIAYWTAGGSGTGSATTANPTDTLVVHQLSSLSAMYPGDSAQTISGNFDNPNANPVHVTKVTASIASVTQAADAVGTCDATDYTLGTPAMTVNAEVPNGNGVSAFSGATIQFKDKPAANQDGCKGATVNLQYDVS
jgi:hypothetical protein